MKTAKRKRLEGAGWRVGAVREFLGLNETEHELVEMREALASGLRTRRERARLTQPALAKRLRSSHHGWRGWRPVIRPCRWTYFFVRT